MGKGDNLGIIFHISANNTYCDLLLEHLASIHSAIRKIISELSKKISPYIELWARLFKTNDIVS